MRRVGKGFSGVETPLFAGMLAIGENVEAEQSIPSPSPPPHPPQDLPSTSSVQPTPPSSPQLQSQAADFPFGLLQTTLDTCAALSSRIKQLESAKISQALEISKLKKRVKRLEKSNKGRMTDELDRDEGVALTAKKEEERKTKEAKNSTGDDQVKRRQAEIYQIDMDHPSKDLSMQEDKPAEVEEVVEVVITAKLITKVVAAASKSVSAASTTIPAAEPQVSVATPTAIPVRVVVAYTRRRKGVVIRDPEEESSAKPPAKTKSKDKGKGIMDIDWDVAIDHVKQKAKEDPYVQRYQVLKKRPQTEAQARRNMMMYLKNVAGFRLDYFKGMSYDDIRLIFDAKFNTNIEFIIKSKEQIEEEEIRAIESINETSAQKAAKRRKLKEEVAELNKHLEIVPDKDDDVFTEATPLARKVLVVDYSIIFLNNKSHYKIIKADGTHQLYISFLTLLKNFDRDDLESLWSIVKERFSTTKPDNFTDDFLLTTLRTMFEEAVRLRVEEQSEMSLELLSFGVDAAIDLEEKHQVFNAAGEELSAAKQNLEALWNLVKERFSTSKPKNFSDDFLLTTLGAMFKKPDGQSQVWRNHRSIHGQAKVKSWKLLESCGVHIITFSTTQLILLVERRYPLSRFTLEQMLNAVRL
nr:hypothetical protein [Tanacetum cinerariifolium]